MIRFLHSKVFTVVGLSLFCVVIFLPPIIYGYVYPNVGDDAAAHLAVFDKIKAGDYQSIPLILSYRLVGYPIVWLSNLSGVSIDALFLWFNYIALSLIGLAIYFVVSQLVSKKAGWLSLVIVLFGAQGILFQFYFGQIFNAINIGLILPLVLFFGVRYLEKGKLYQLVLPLLLGALFGAFHTSGIYLPFVAGMGLFCYIVYCLIRKEHITSHPIYFGSGVLVLSLIGFLLSITNTGDLWNATVYHTGDLWDATRRGVGQVVLPIGSYLMGIVSPTVLVIVVFVLLNIKVIWKGMPTITKGAVIILTCFVVVLSVASFTGLSLDPFRQALDFATILALLVSVLIGSVVWTRKNQMAMVVVFFAVVFGLWHNLPAWFDYNSAIRSADKEAIAYVNTLNRASYSSSPEVAFWIYDRFIMAKYKTSPDVEGFYAPILITRDIPMTPRSDLKNKWYDGHGIEADEGFNLLKTFDDGKVTVRVYENVGHQVIKPLGAR